MRSYGHQVYWIIQSVLLIMMACSSTAEQLLYTEPNGNISTFNFQPLTESTVYEFTIQTENTRYVEIVFGLFEIASENGLCTDTVEVIDDAFGRRSLTGQRCGESMPTVRSTTNNVVIILTIGDAESRSEFEAAYRTVDIPGCAFGTNECKDLAQKTCNHICNTTTGMIASLNYPHAYIPYLKMEWEIYVPIGSYVQIEVVHFDLRLDESCEGDVLEFSRLTSDDDNGDARNPKICPPLSGDEQIDSLSNYIRVIFETDDVEEGSGFVLRYTTRRFEPNLIDKNITGSCPLGWNKYNDQCYLFQDVGTTIDWHTAQAHCVDTGANLASIRTSDEMHYIHSTLIDNPGVIGEYVYIGLVRETFGHQLFRWIDGRPASYMDWYLSSIYSSGEFSSRQPGSSSVDQCTVIKIKSVAGTDLWRDVACSRGRGQHIICQRSLLDYVNMKSAVLKVPGVIDSSPCQSDHQFKCSTGDCIAHAFVCDGIKDCFDGSDEEPLICTSREKHSTLFCPNEKLCISLSLICDGTMDLKHGIDESDCVYATCSESEFQCGTGNCINKTLVCNGIEDCQDGDDELKCVDCAPGFFQCYDSSCIPNHAICDASKDCDGRNYEDEPDECNYIEETSGYCLDDEVICNNGACVSKSLLCLYDIDQYGIQLGCRDVTHLQNCEEFECPDYMYKCPESYCIPMRRRCDAIWDCPNGEDEKNCSTYSCPDYYHCRSSSQCLSPLEVCDGVKHCPTGDDEQFCDISCPSTCTCSGFIVNCSSFSLSIADVNLLPASARYLNLSGSLNDSITEAQQFFMIIDKFHFLDTLDLSNNYLDSLTVGGLASLVNLKNLNLSRSHIGSHLEDGTFRHLSKLAILDLSHNGIVKIDKDVFEDVDNITELYIEGNAITDIDPDVFDDLNLTIMVSDYFRFCCMTNATTCFPEEDEFSSCKDLMRETVLRVFIWILGLSALVGNLCVIIWRLRTKEVNKVQGYLIQNLAVSDFFMGVYLLIIASADIYYRGSYVFYDTIWKNSWVCSLAGFLAAFSSEMSVYILTVITIDRFICIVYPFSRYKMRAKGAIRILVIGWVLVFLVSIVPAIIIQGEKKFYGANSVCLALPITHQEIPAPLYSIIIFLGVNLLCFLVMAVCYTGMYISVKKSANSLKSNINHDNKKKDLKMTIKMAVIVLTDMVCWFPIILMGILARCGVVEIPGDVYAWTAVFILPLNSAINPHLYTFSAYVTLDKKRKATPTASSTPGDEKNKSIVPENVTRKRQLLPYLRASSSSAVTISERLESSGESDLNDEELSAIEIQYLKAVENIQKSRQGQRDLSVDVEAVTKM